MKQEAAWELERNQKLIIFYHLLCNHYPTSLSALFSTDPTQTAEEIVSDFMKRRSLETTDRGKAMRI